MPFFSVIIPLYNKEKFIENTINSVLNQTFTDYELIIVNDGSTDKSSEVVLQFEDERIHYLEQENLGVSSARNLGISFAKSDYIAFLDADDYWFSNFLEEIAVMINNFPNQKVFSAAFEIETSNKIIPAQYSIEKSDHYQVVNYFEASCKESIIWTSSAAFHKDVFKEIGNFDTNIKSGQDTDLWIRIGLVYPIVFTEKILARYIYDATSLSKTKMNVKDKMNFEKFALTEKSNPNLKQFLDFNRFSLAIKCKMNNDKANFNYYSNSIDLRNLTLKKRILLNLPSFVLKFLIRLNLFLVKIGLRQSVFK